MALILTYWRFFFISSMFAVFVRFTFPLNFSNHAHIGMSRGDHDRKPLKTRTEWIVFEMKQYILLKHGIIYNL